MDLCSPILRWPQSLWALAVKTRVFYIEGNIGVGKTECAKCVCEMLREKGLKATVVEEGEHAWEGDAMAESEVGAGVFAAHGALKGHLYRENFVNNEGAAFDVLLVERHPTTTLEVFDDSASTRELFEGVDVMSGSTFMSNPVRTIYLKSSADECFARAKTRGKLSGTTLDEFAFESFGLKYEEMMTKREAMGGTVFAFEAFSTDADHRRIVDRLGI